MVKITPRYFVLYDSEAFDIVPEPTKTIATPKQLDILRKWNHTESEVHKICESKPEPIKQPTSNRTQGILSPKSIIRIRNCTAWLAFLAKPKTIYMKSENRSLKFKVSLITLTLSSKQEHSDRQIKSFILQPFLRRLRGQYGIINYIWKAETQQNGNIHFHLVIDKFIHYMDLRNLWNNWQEALGYVTRSTIENPNSTDVHSIKNVRNLAAYLCKYLSKNSDGRRLIEGKLWDCNKELKAIKVVSEMEDHLIPELEAMESRSDRVMEGIWAKVVMIKKEEIYRFPKVKSLVTKEIIKQYSPNDYKSDIV